MYYDILRNAEEDEAEGEQEKQYLFALLYQLQSTNTHGWFS